MTITQINYFLEVAKTQSYTKAAKNLYVSQQVVSKQIRLLEEDLGIILFEKQGKSIKLSLSGQLLYDLWNRHARETASVLSEATLISNKKQIVTIGVIDLRYVIDMVTPKIQELKKRFPSIEFKYFLGDLATLEHAMGNGDIDIAITLSAELPTSIPQENISMIQDIQLGVFMNRNHPLADRESIQLTDLIHETFYLFSESYSQESYQKVLIDCRVHGFQPVRVEYFNDIHSMEFALISGNGIAVGFDIFFQDPGNHLKMFPLVALNRDMKADLVVAWNNTFLRDIAQTFVSEQIQTKE